MDLKQLKYFSAIVEHGSFRKAAEALHITPPALSLSIKSLEQELDVALLERNPGRILPTAFGHSLYESAQRIDVEVQSAFAALNRMRGIGSGRLAIGILPYGISSAMGRLIGRFCDRYPGLEVQTAIGSFSFLAERLKNGDLDFLVTEVQSKQRDKNLTEEPLFRLRYALVVGHKHPLAGRRNLTLKRVLDYPLAYAATWGTVLENWNEAFRSEGLEPPKSAIGAATDEFFRDLIANCNTIAVLPMIGTIREAVDAGQLAELHLPRVHWFSTVGLAYRTGESLSPDAQLLLEETRATLAEPEKRIALPGVG